MPAAHLRRNGGACECGRPAVGNSRYCANCRDGARKTYMDRVRLADFNRHYTVDAIHKIHDQAEAAAWLADDGSPPATVELLRGNTSFAHWCRKLNGSLAIGPWEKDAQSGKLAIVLPSQGAAEAVVAVLEEWGQIARVVGGPSENHDRMRPVPKKKGNGWGGKRPGSGRKPGPRPPRDTLVGAMVTQEEREQVARLAESEGITVSTWLRRLIHKALR